MKATSTLFLCKKMQKCLKKTTIKGSKDSHQDVYYPNIQNKMKLIEELMNVDFNIVSKIKPWSVEQGTRNRTISKGYF